MMQIVELKESFLSHGPQKEMWSGKIQASIFSLTLLEWINYCKEKKEIQLVTRSEKQIWQQQAHRDHQFKA